MICARFTPAQLNRGAGIFAAGLWMILAGIYVWDDSGMVNVSETVSRDIDIAVVFGLAWFRGMARAPGLVWRVGQRG